MKVYFGSDHRGFQLKQQFIAAFKDANELGVAIDLGPAEAVPGDDYNVAARAVAKRVAEETSSGGGSASAGDLASAGNSAFEGDTASVGDSASGGDAASVNGAGATRSGSARGVLICGSGVGMAIQANRFRGVRAVATSDIEVVKIAREHNDVNVLCLGADLVEFTTATKLIRAFLETEFLGEERLVRRNRMLDEEVQSASGVADSSEEGF